MTTPNNEHTVVARFDPEMQAWSIISHSPGPAGVVSVLLDEDVRLSVDAADPSRLVELAVAATPDGQVSTAILVILRSLFGDGLADMLSKRGTIRQQPASLDVHPGVMFYEAAALAQAEMMQSVRPTRHTLRDLDVVLHANRIDNDAMRRYAVEAAWELWPSVAALARTSGSHLDMILYTGSEVRRELKARLLTLQRVLEIDYSEVANTPAFHSVSILIADLSDERPDLLAGKSRDEIAEAAEAALSGAGANPEIEDELYVDIRYMGESEVSVPMFWQGHVDDFAARLGSEVKVLHDGFVTAEGEIPGTVAVAVPVALGVTTHDLSNIRVRVMSRQGELLGEGGLTVERGPNALPVGRSEIAISDEVAGLAGDYIAIDLAQQLIPVPNAEDLKRLSRLRATRAGQSAVAAATAGDHAASAEYWRECVRHLESHGDSVRAAMAGKYADQADDDARNGSRQQASPDWLGALLDGWSRWLRDELARIGDEARHPADEPPSAVDPDSSDTIDRLRELIDMIGGWNDPSPELARAHADLAAQLRVTDAASRDEVEFHLREAVRIYYDLDLNTEAVACLRELGIRANRG